MTTDSDRLRGFDCLCGNFRMASRALTSMYDAHLEPTGISVAQLALLWCVVARAPVAIGDIARIVAMDKTTATRGVGRLAALGLVRIGKGGDARRRLVSSTARGRDAFARAMPAWRAAQAQAARMLGRKQAAALARHSLELARAVNR